jgi:oxalyl-CoA decarboxylase
MIEITAAGYDHFRASRLADKLGPQVPNTETSMTNNVSVEVTDGFHLVIDALKHNDIDTIFGLVGIPITDLARLAQAEGMRFIGFRHEANAGNAAAIAGYMTQEAGHLPDRLGAGLPERPDRAGQRHHQLLPDDPDLRLLSEREIVDLQQGDYEEMDQLNAAKPYAKASYRINQGRGHRHRRGACHPRRRLRPSRRRLPRPAGQAAGQTMDAAAGQRSLVKVVDPAPRQLPAPDAVAARARRAQEAPSAR